MRFRWDEKKSEKLKRERGLSFDEVATLFEKPYCISPKQDEPEQWRVVGWVGDKLVSLVYEEREDDEGPFYWCVTYWFATKAERSLYEQG